VVPQILSMLVNKSPSSHKRAAAYAISRMLTMDSNFSHNTLVSATVLPILQDPFLHVGYATSAAATQAGPSSPNMRLSLAPTAALSMLITLSTNMDPSPTLLTSLLLPILPPLYSLLAHMDQIKTSDPLLKESLRSLLRTWGRVSGVQEGIEALWDIICGGGGEWEILIDGGIKLIEK
jgi:hypothetical protein